MEGCAERIGFAMREAVSSCFVVPQLAGYGMACVEDKLRESLLFGRMTVLHYRAFGGEDEGIYRAAAAVELMILSLDIIDDLQDQDNRSQVWNEIAPEIALNIALGFLTLAQQQLLSGPFPQDRLAGAAQLMNVQVLGAINGQTTDLINEISGEEEYIEMVKQKSAGLLAAACLIGTLLATGEVNEAVRSYAVELGIAAQMKNDIRDLLNWDNKNDFLNRKKTLSTLYLLESATGEQQWIADYFAGRLELADVAHRKAEIETILEQTGTYLYSSVRMRTHYYNYLNLLDGLGLAPEWREQMLALSE